VVLDSAVARHWSVGRDKVTRLVKRGLLKAMVLSERIRGRRIYEVRRILGAEILRFERERTA